MDSRLPHSVDIYSSEILRLLKARSNRNEWLHAFRNFRSDILYSGYSMPSPSFAFLLHYEVQTTQKRHSYISENVAILYLCLFLRELCLFWLISYWFVGMENVIPIVIETNWIWNASFGEGDSYLFQNNLSRGGPLPRILLINQKVWMFGMFVCLDICSSICLFVQ